MDALLVWLEVRPDVRLNMRLDVRDMALANLANLAVQPLRVNHLEPLPPCAGA